MENGSFDLELVGGERAVIEGLPGGTQYSVYEETPDGWQLIDTENITVVVPSD